MENSVGLGALSMVPTYSMAFMTEIGATHLVRKIYEAIF